MAVLFLMSGGNFLSSSSANGPGIFISSNNPAITSTAPAGRANTYAYKSSPAFGNMNLLTYAFPNGPYSGLIAGEAQYIGPLFAAGDALLTFVDISNAIQCEVRINAFAQLYVVNSSGTTIAGPSGYALTIGAWFYLEFKALFSTSSAGTCEIRINGQVVLTDTGLTNASGVSSASAVTFKGGNNHGAGNTCYVTDMYCLATSSGVNTTYLGDITVQEIYPTGAGVNSQWTANVGPFSITSVASGTGVYSGTITGGTSNAYQGYYFVASTFAQGANNGTFLCTTSSASALTLANAASVTDTTGSCAFQCIVQPGIAQIGTRPNNDVTYIVDATSGHISDFAHQSIASTNTTIAAISHLTYARKDDVGTRVIDQAVLLGATTALSNVSLTNSYVYYIQVMDADPNSNPWTIINFNNTTAGVKEVT